MFAVATLRMKPRKRLRPRSALGQLSGDAHPRSAGRVLPSPFAVAISWLKPIPPMRPRSAPGQRSVVIQAENAGRVLIQFAVASERVKPILLLRPRAPGQLMRDAQDEDAGRALFLEMMNEH
jgi:hypothetical protein